MNLFGRFGENIGPYSFRDDAAQENKPARPGIQPSFRDFLRNHKLPNVWGSAAIEQYGNWIMTGRDMYRIWVFKDQDWLVYASFNGVNDGLVFDIYKSESKANPLYIVSKIVNPDTDQISARIATAVCRYAFMKRLSPEPVLWSYFILNKGTDNWLNRLTFEQDICKADTPELPLSDDSLVLKDTISLDSDHELGLFEINIREFFKFGLSSEIISQTLMDEIITKFGE